MDANASTGGYRERQAAEHRLAGGVFAPLIASLVLLSAPPATAKSLRGVSIGDTCATAFETELARGSTPTRPLSEVEPSDLVVFRGAHDGEQALVGFTCVDGLLTKQLVAFKLTTEAEADATFDRQYKQLVDLFGKPCTDWRKLSLWQRFKLWASGLYLPELYTHVTWDLGDDLRLTLNSGPSGPGPDYWAVSVGVSGPPAIFIREPDGTETRVQSPMTCLHGE